MTLFTDSPYEKMMIQKPEDGETEEEQPEEADEGQEDKDV